MARNAADDPRPLHQELECELSRIYDAFGHNETLLRVRGVEDSVRESPEQRRRRIDKLAGVSYAINGPECDSLNKIGDAEAPLIPLDSALMVDRFRP